MSEKRRTFHALRGDVFPRVGDLAIYVESFVGIAAPDYSFEEKRKRMVEVVRVSVTGATIWTRFVCLDGQQEYGDGVQLHCWSRLENRYYGMGTLAPVGEVRFR